MFRFIILIGLLFSFQQNIPAQTAEIFPTKGLCIAAPNAGNLERFNKFIIEELAPRGLNTLILRIDHNYTYTSRPELRSKNPLSKAQVKQLVETCREHNIRLIPQINLLGHQSWASTLGKLLEVYPEFDETPHVKIPEEYKWPNDDGLYCKSYCPLHPEVHAVVFDMVDEICEVFEADAFHAGLDEVFYLGESTCPRCSGRDKAELFAGEVRKIRDHLALKNRELWIWGDRLIDGKNTGIGMWEASFNNTHRAVDMIPKDIVICDWHYERPDKTAVYFAMKGFQVITCPWRNPKIAEQQTADMLGFRKGATKEMQPRFRGMMQTIWSGVDSFLDEFYGIKEVQNEQSLSQAACFRKMFSKIEELENN